MSNVQTYRSYFVFTYNRVECRKEKNIWNSLFSRFNYNCISKLCIKHCMVFELEERTFQFALRVRKFCRELKQDRINLEDITQLVRASGSIGSNYIEANENLGKGDKRMHLKISRKESKECSYWLRLLFIEGDNLVLENEKNMLIDEANQFRKIFSSILDKLPI